MELPFLCGEMVSSFMMSSMKTLYEHPEFESEDLRASCKLLKAKFGSEKFEMESHCM